MSRQQIINRIKKAQADFKNAPFYHMALEADDRLQAALDDLNNLTE